MRTCEQKQKDIHHAGNNLRQKKVTIGKRTKYLQCSSIVNEAIKTNSVFFKKNFCNTQKKKKKKVKLTNKIKTSEY